jgi:uracil-DNA glycosylase
MADEMKALKVPKRSSKKRIASKKIDEFLEAKNEDVACSEEVVSTTSLKNSVSEDVARLDSQIHVCTLCGLSQSRKNAVPGDGNFRMPRLMLVGEGPGRKEDIVGEPFVGAAGKLLNSLLEKAGIMRTEVYITNIVKCRPPNNRKPAPEEIEICTSNYLEKQIELMKPKIICTFGLTALQYFTGEKSMGENHGKPAKSTKGIPVFPTYHPAAVFRNRSLKEALEQDLIRLSSSLKEIKD